MSFLGLDVGEKKVGLAVSTSGKLAREMPPVLIKKNLPIESAERLAVLDILEIIENHKIKKIVVGLPYNEDGKEALQAKFIRRFVERLEERTKLPIIFEDESDTTSEAERILKEQGMTFFEAKQRVDGLAARLLLEQYLRQNEK